MKLDYLTQVKKIKECNDLNLAHHLWLEGINKINSNSTLDSGLVNVHTEIRLSQHKKFTPLISSSFLSFRTESIESGKLRVIHYPLDDEFHLLFSLENSLIGEKLVYLECSERCRILSPYNFPYAELRKSLDFSENEEAMKSIEKGTFCFDNIVNVKSQTPDQIIKQYKIFGEFLEQTRIN